MIIVQAILTIALLMINSVGQGLLFIRRLGWRPMETLCASVALSFFLIYFETLIIYALNLPPAWAYLTTVLSAIATLVSLGDLRRLWRNRETRAAMLAFPALVAWLFLFLMIARNYSGARWFGDWFEHFQRARFFSEHQPANTNFLGVYVLPARPPMMNLLTADVFWQVPASFAVFQVVFSYLNALVIFPCALIAPSLIAKTRNRAWLIAGFLALSPMFVQNGTYTWTKAFAAFYDLVALGLYLSAWRRHDSPRMIAAFACLAVALLVHYSAAVLVLFLGFHYLLVLFRHRSHKWRELIASAAIGAAIFSTWLGWSLYTYGAKDTFGSNTTVTASQEFSLGENLQKIAENTFNTLVPFPLRGVYENDPAYNLQAPPKGAAYLRDWCFSIYQTEFPAMLGFGSLLLVVWLLGKFYFRPPQDHWQHRYRFWFFFVVIVTFLSIAVHGEYDYLGVAHICLQPVVLLGLTWAAVGLPQAPPVLRGAALVGLCVDAALGILLHFYILHKEFDLAQQGNQLHIRTNVDVGLAAIANSVTKLNNHLVFLGDHAADFAGLIEALTALGIPAICIGLWFLAARSAPPKMLVRAPIKSKKPPKKRPRARR